MSIAKTVLSEERENLLRQLARAESQLAELPEGTIHLKKIKGRIYPYRVYRSGEKVVSVLVKQSESLDDLQVQIARRVKLKKKIQKIKSEIRMIDLSLKRVRT